MTLNQIFDNIQYGEKYMKEKALKEAIEKCYDKELDIFYASKRIKELSGNVLMTEAEELKVNRIISKVEVLENKLEVGKTMSEAYRKMQTTALMEDCKALNEEITKSRRVDSKKLEAFGKINGAVKAFVENYVDDKCVLRESTNPLLNKTIRDEIEVIKEVL